MNTEPKTPQTNTQASIAWKGSPNAMAQLRAILDSRTPLYQRAHAQLEEQLEATYWDELDQMLSRVDIVSVNCPFTPETYHLLNSERLALLPREAYVVNAARGEIIDETAFYLGIGVTGAVHTIDPGIVVLGGAMNFGGSDCSIGQRFLKGITEEFRRRTFPNVAEGTKIEFASLGGAAGHIGAAGIARVDYHAGK